MRNYRPIAALSLLLAMMAGCASNGTAPDDSAHGPHARCMVCEHNADLACVDVAVDSKTPQYMYQGQTYYFCSEQCRDEFAKNPARYAK